jgi:hypothetical protein
MRKALANHLQNNEREIAKSLQEAVLSPAAGGHSGRNAASRGGRL